MAATRYPSRKVARTHNPYRIACYYALLIAVIIACGIYDTMDIYNIPIATAMTITIGASYIHIIHATRHRTLDEVDRYRMRYNFDRNPDNQSRNR